MWSDRLSTDRLQFLVDQIRCVLPPPSRAASFQTTFQSTTDFDRVAELLQAEPGFAYIRRAKNHRSDTLPVLLQKPIAAVSYWGEHAIVSGPNGKKRINGSSFEILEAVLEAWHGLSGAMLAGYLSYELAFELEDVGPVPPTTFELPLFEFGLYDSQLWYEDEAWTLCGTDAWRTIETAVIEDLLNATKPALTSAQLASNIQLKEEPGRAGFEASVERIVSAVHRGDIFQTNLCRMVSAECSPDQAWSLFQRLRTISPARYEAYLRGCDANFRSIASISPELFLKVDGGVVESSPIKGTRPRGNTMEEDQRLISDLTHSEKDRAELAMIVDVVRNDLGRVCETGSVQVVAHGELLTLPTVHHSYSTIKGRLRAGTGLIEVIRAAFPAASISGAPKIEAVRLAAGEERQCRGPCMGAIGWIGLDGSMELSVAIRTAFVADSAVRYYAGCGITADSDPQMEYMESQHKIAAFARALGIEAKN